VEEERLKVGVPAEDARGGERVPEIKRKREREQESDMWVPV
jgi:hypothetical protein